MLKEELVARIALCFSIIGIASILILETLFQPTEIQISEISEKSIGKNVRVKGIVEWKREKTGLTFFGLSDGKGIKCVASKKVFSEKIAPKKFLVVEGRVEEYLGEMEILVKTVREWES